MAYACWFFLLLSERIWLVLLGLGLGLGLEVRVRLGLGLIDMCKKNFMNKFCLFFVDFLAF